MIRNAIRRVLTSILLSAATAILSLPAAAASSVVVTTSAELEAALVPANAGAQIFVMEGEYAVSNSLTVPDGATLAGEGVMSFDGSGLPTGIAPSGRTVLRASPTLAGDVLTLGNGSTLRNLVIEPSRTLYLHGLQCGWSRPAGLLRSGEDSKAPAPAAEIASAADVSS